jgi:hypothetical protein
MHSKGRLQVYKLCANISERAQAPQCASPRASVSCRGTKDDSARRSKEPTSHTLRVVQFSRIVKKHETWLLEHVCLKEGASGRLKLFQKLRQTL